MGNDYFTPNFWAGRGSEMVGRRGPRISPKVSRIIRGTYGAQSSNLELQKNLPWTNMQLLRILSEKNMYFSCCITFYLILKVNIA